MAYVKARYIEGKLRKRFGGAGGPDNYRLPVMPTGGTFKFSQSGGNRARAYVRDKIRQMKRLEGKVHTVGFHDARMAALAETHEFGLRGEDGSEKLPERPAFRAARRDVEREWRKATRKAAAALSSPRGNARDVDRHLRRGARAAREAIKESYRGFHGARLSEVQKARKRSTPGQGRQLVGHKGERLIKHIEARTPDGETIK